MYNSKVYIVTSGSYSDYQIDGVFSTEERAEAFITATGLYDGRAVRWDVDLDAEKIDRGLVHYKVDMDIEGNVRHMKKSTPVCPERAFGRIRGYDHKGSQWLEAYIWARNEEHAVKIANERRTRILALNLWKRGYVQAI